MKNNFNNINENFKDAFESAIPKGFSSTVHIAKRGQWGNQLRSEASSSHHRSVIG